MCYSIEAPKYFKKGINVIPTIVKEKRCGISNWRDVDFESSYSEFVNNGIALDVASIEIVVLDIDVLNKDAQREINEVLKDHSTPIMRMGNPNKLPSRFYRRTWQDKKLKANGIELFAAKNKEMYQVVLPPTKHPEFDDVYFKWVGDYNLLNFDVDDLPDLPIDVYNKIQEIALKYSPRAESGKVIEIMPSDGTRCNHGSHIKLSDILMASIYASENIEDIAVKLLAYDETINTKISFFLCHTEKWRTANKTFNCYQFIMKAVENHLKKGDVKDIYTGRSLAIDFSPKKKVAKDKAIYPKPVEGSYLELIMRNIIENSPKAKMKFAYFSALATMGHILSNNIECSGMTTNIMTAFVDRSGGGKNDVLKFCKNLLLEASLFETIGVDEIGSSSFILDDLVNNRKKVYSIDEVSSLFGSIGKDGSFNEDTGTTLSKLYSAALGEFSGKGVKGGGAYGMCHSPAISIISATTYSELSRTFKIDNFGQGIGSRFLFCFDDTRVKHRRINNRTIYDTLKDMAKFYMKPFLPEREHRRIPKKDFKPKKNQEIHDEDIYNIIFKPIPRKLLFSKDIGDLVDILITDLDEMAFNEETEIMQPIIARGYDIFIKVFMISVVANRDSLDNHHTPSMIDFEFAKNFTMAYIDDCRHYLVNSIKHSKWVEEEDELLKIIIEKYKKKGSALTKVDIKNPKFTGKSMESVLRSLELSEKIIYEPKRGKNSALIVPSEVD